MEDWELDFQWLALKHKVKTLIDAEVIPDMKSILFLIGVQEYGRVRKDFSKEEKQDLMHIAVCSILEKEGYYKFAGRDDEGWPHWEVSKPFKVKGVAEQEAILKRNIIEYFKHFE